MSEQPFDADLVQQALAGRGEAFGELVARYRDAVFGVAFHRLGDFEEARDAAQDTFLKAYLNLAGLRDPAAFASWLYRIADGTALDAARRARRDISLVEAEAGPDPTAAAEQSDIARQVRQALEGLGEQSRLAVILHYVNGYTHAEIARFLGATPQAVKTRLSRARGKLREEMAEMAEERIKGAAGGRKLHAYRYIAKASDGKTISGTAEAESAEALVRRLREKGYFMQKVEGPAFEKHRPLTEEERKEPIRKIVGGILEQAVKDGAQSIRLEPRAEPDPRQMSVYYLIGDNWHEVMSVPMYVWGSLRERFVEMAGLRLRDDDRRQMGTISFRCAERERSAKVTFSRNRVMVDLKTGAAAG